MRAIQYACLSLESVLCVEFRSIPTAYPKFPLDLPIPTKDTIGFPLLRVFKITITHPGDLGACTSREGLSRRFLAFLSSASELRTLVLNFVPCKKGVGEFLNLFTARFKSKALKELGIDTVMFHEQDLVRKVFGKALHDSRSFPCVYGSLVDVQWTLVLTHIRDGLISLTNIELRSMDTDGDEED
jgi:hypothetical protein